MHRFWAQVRYKDGVLSEASVRRQDGRPIGRQLPIGWHNMGPFVVEPVAAGQKQIELFTEHDCDGRTVSTEFAKIEFDQIPDAKQE